MGGMKRDSSATPTSHVAIRKTNTLVLLPTCSLILGCAAAPFLEMSRDFHAKSMLLNESNLPRATNRLAFVVDSRLEHVLAV